MRTSELGRELPPGAVAPAPGGRPDQAPGLLAVPQEWAYETLLFAHRNPGACMLLDVTEAGSPRSRLAPEADLRCAMPRYQVWCDGELVDVRREVLELWHTDLVAFLFGRSAGVDAILAAAGIPLRHVEQGRILPTYRSTVECRRAGQVRGPLRVSMRPIPVELVRRAEQVTNALLYAGRPVQVGNPWALGIRDLGKPDDGDPVRVERDDVAVFWPDEATLIGAVLAARPPLLLLDGPTGADQSADSRSPGRESAD